MPFAVTHVHLEWLAQLEMEKRPECGNAKNGGVMCLMGAGSREAENNHGCRKHEERCTRQVGEEERCTPGLELWLKWHSAWVGRRKVLAQVQHRGSSCPTSCGLGAQMWTNGTFASAPSTVTGHAR